MNAMEFEDIGRVWREEGTGELRRTRIENVSTVLGRASRVNAEARRRIALAGWVIGLPLIPVFAYVAARAPTPLATVGAVILTIFAMAVLLEYRAISRTTSDKTLPVRLAMEAEIARLRALERFPRNAKWLRAVYASGFLLYALGIVIQAADLRVRIAGIAISLSVLALMEVLVRFARRPGPSSTRELREDLESWLGGLEEFEHDGATDGPDVGPSWRA